MRTTIQADGTGQGWRARKELKRQKARQERHRARLRPDCFPGYGKYRGYFL